MIADLVMDFAMCSPPLRLVRVNGRAYEDGHRPCQASVILLKRRAILNRIVPSVRASVDWGSQGVQESELTRRREFPIRAEARLGVLDVIQGRVLSVLGGVVHTEQIVLGVTLSGRASRVTNQPSELRGWYQLAVAGAGRRRDGLVDQRAAHVVGARREQTLRELRSFLDPRGLDVAESRSEEETRHRMHLHDFESGRARPYAGHQPAPIHRSVLMDERERDELGETAGVLLAAAQEVHVPDPVLVALDVSVHDRRRRADSLSVSAGDDLDPLVHRDAAPGDDVADLLVQDL